MYQMVSDVHHGQESRQEMLADIDDYGIVTHRDKANDVFNDLFNLLLKLRLPINNRNLEPPYRTSLLLGFCVNLRQQYP